MNKQAFELGFYNSLTKRAFSFNDINLGTLAGAGLGGGLGYLSSKLTGFNPWLSIIAGVGTGGYGGYALDKYTGFTKNIDYDLLMKEHEKILKEDSDIENMARVAPYATPRAISVRR